MYNNFYCEEKRDYLINNNNVDIYLTLIDSLLYFQFNLYYTNSFFRREILQNTIDFECFKVIDNNNNCVRDHVFF